MKSPVGWRNPFREMKTACGQSDPPSRVPFNFLFRVAIDDETYRLDDAAQTDLLPRDCASEICARFLLPLLVFTRGHSAGHREHRCERYHAKDTHGGQNETLLAGLRGLDSNAEAPFHVILLPIDFPPARGANHQQTDYLTYTFVLFQSD
jgi:hypothetical protein